MASISSRKIDAYNTDNIQNAVNLAVQYFKNGDYFTCFDIIEQLYSRYSNDYLPILNAAFQFYQNLPVKTRYYQYQGRFYDFKFEPGDKVLDIGSGHLPFPFATHLCDIDLEEGKVGRAGIPFMYVEGKKIIRCDIENLPFEEKEFDFVYCSHILEHVHNPEKACSEIIRVGKAGYLESPTIGKDTFFNTARVSNHLWYLSKFNDIIYFNQYGENEKVGLGSNILADMHGEPRTDRDRALSALIYLKANMLNVMHGWTGSFEYAVNRIEENSNMPANQAKMTARG